MKNKNKIIYNPDYSVVNKTIENLNNKSDEDDIKYEFKNQRMCKLAMEYLENKFGSIPL